MPTTTETAASINERFEATALPLHDSIYRANLRMTGDPVMAQDLTQETYLRAFRAFDSFQAGTNCRAWMLQISHNLFCRDYRGRKRITYRTAADDDVDVLAQFRADVPNPEEEALRQLDREALRRAISKLPEPYRVAVTLVELQGLSCEEAAAVMGTPKGTVLSRLFRARERLRRLLLSEFGRARLGASAARRTESADEDVLAQFQADVPNPEEALRQLNREALRQAISMLSKLPEPYRVG